MAARSLRGLEERQEQKTAHLVRDTRSVGQRIADFIKTPSAVALLLVMSAAAIIIIPSVAEPVYLICAFIFIFAITHKATLPFRMPQRSHAPDYNDPAPGSSKPRKARGIYYFANE